MKNPFLLFVLICVLFSCKKIPLQVTGTEAFYEDSLAPFYHGVASGDPLIDRVILWTRVSPKSHKNIKVEWEISKEETFSSIIANGVSLTDSSKDYTVKVDVTGLLPGTQYYYRFKALNKYSSVGETKTLKNSDNENINLGVVSCSNYEWGFFSAYRHLSKKNLDAVLHLGDYFYEYAPGTYGDTTLGRLNIPPREIISLSDYRTRYAQYRLDKDLQNIHLKHPFITIWDDHEISNNAYISGAQNHQENEGDYFVRKAIAKQAYYEWMPIRGSQSDAHYRDFSFGNLVHLVMLDERLAGRKKQADSLSQVDDSYTMLGKKQLNWFEEKLTKSNATWKIIGNQVIFSPLDISVLNQKRPANLDAWDGYSSERDNIVSTIRNSSINNVVFLTGDTHTSWAFEVPTSIAEYQKSNINYAVELGVTSITSANWNEGDRTDEDVIEAEKLILSSNPHLKYVNAREHGYLLLTIDKTNLQADFYMVDDVKDINSGERLVKTFNVKTNTQKLQ